ncbi:DNA polymerase IV [Noviherbaspirillum sp. Root189]|uniref:DNA polymerase IV n=1 Tax=Noviherbaspirillum sp. Root189 TaxID=1736487 RepID=UPI00070EB3E0|nr:DNA polymerase IV [Noviherbaspirillum sp. Root189]KRB94290.1 DNA polymerase IV [Noviherbaspirillum sp. Root189]
MESTFLPCCYRQIVNAPLRKIIHCDCDCFYAAVEMRDDPSLRGRPLAVGGRPDQRGVVATCNYEARKFGVRSAMATSQALQRCPDLIVLPPAMDKYRAASKQILAIYRDYTDLVEPLSLDEAYLDVTDSPHCRNSATLIAEEIRTRIAATVGITASAGIAPNKFIAKIASDWNKPNGQFVVRPHEVDAFVAALPVDKLFGVGKVTAAKLKKLGAFTCADLRQWPINELQHHFGKFGGSLYNLCRGVDRRQVSPSQERKSVSVEETYVTDLPDLAACERELDDLIAKLEQRIRRANAERATHKLFVKIRFANFQRTTAECVSSILDPGLCRKLLDTAWQRGRRPVRLLGVGVRLNEEEELLQLGLFGDESTPSSAPDTITAI